MLTPLQLKSALRGTIVAMTTPFNRDLSLDLKGLRDYTEYLIENGIRLLIPAGSSGEFFSLTEEERRQVIETVIETSNGRALVIAGAPHSGTALCSKLVGDCRRMGADGVMVTPPYYEFDGFQGIHDHFQQVSDENEIGIFVYISGAVVAKMAPVINNLSLLEKLFEIPNVVALKDSTNNHIFYRDACLRLRDRGAVIGSGGLNYYIWGSLWGSPGTIAGIGNFYPAIEIEFLDLMNRGRITEATALVRRYELPYLEITKQLGYHASVKAIMDWMGLPGGPMRPPRVTLSEEARKKLLAVMEQSGLMEMILHSKAAV
ncbi:MAG: dihydrodipicolinate synthase family protein [Acidobacteria bacterium]|nr:dihydrodipicolinate synthase family protein [Acidobacteriota bacterium]